MLTFYDSENHRHVLGARLGSGGEGVVYACEGTDLVAKIYHEAIDEEKIEKLLWMARHKNDQLLKIAAWVVDVLYDAPGGRVVGFLMPNVRAKEIHELYSLKSRRVHFPEATWHFLVHTAANLARAFYLLHKNSHIMGDINHGNCVVLADGTVKLIDCDSYSVQTDKKRYACEVGVMTHLAPELQRADLGEIEREYKHDNFGLAVIVFQLLFLGRHPFAGNYLGDEDKSLEDCIRELRFAYGGNPELTQVRQPPGTLSLSDVSTRVAALFERAFRTDDRPEPREWIEALEDLSNNLEQCGLHPGHYYFKALAACPWCGIESQTGLMLFPFVTSGVGARGEKTFDIFTIEHLLSNLGLKQNLPARPPAPVAAPPPPPSREIVEKTRHIRLRRFLIVGGHLLGLVFLVVVMGSVGSFCLGLFVLVISILLLDNIGKYDRLEALDRLNQASQEWEELETEWGRALAPPDLDQNLTKIRAKIGDYQNFQKSNFKLMQQRQSENRRLELEKYLRGFNLASAEGPDLDQEKFLALAAKGIKTAADIEKSRLQYVVSVDETVKSKLFEWRAELERNFEYDEAELPDEIKKQFAQETSETRRQIEKEIERIFGSLRAVSVNLRQKQKQLMSKSETLAASLQQARSDASALGSNAPAIAILFAMTLFMPFFAGVARLSSAPPTPLKRATPYSSTPSYSTTTDPMLKPNGAARETVDIPKESISDKEIAKMTSQRRAEIVEALSSEAESIGDQKKAERKLLFALRFNADRVRVLGQLGYLLYDMARYEESLGYAREALKIDRKDYSAHELVGVNYIKLKKFPAAKKTFIEVTEQFPEVYSGFFNLGLVYKELRDYRAAAEALRRAVKIDPSSVTARYNLGVCLGKIGDGAGAYEEYRVLSGIDAEKAAKLRKEANLLIIEENAKEPVKTVGEGRPD